MRVFLTLLLGGWLLATTAAANEPLEFASADEEARFQQLTQELRCLVCQNQNLADSDAPLAHDLRVEIHDMLQAGRSNAEIKTFLVERYGEFVLYRPPVKGNTLALWLMPLILLLGGAAVVAVAVRRRASLPDEPAGTDEELNN